MKRPSNLKNAFAETPNLLGLASAFALSAAFLNPLPLLVGLAAEAGYLIFTPDSKWYTRLLEKRYQAEVDKRRAELKRQVFPYLTDGERERFERLEQSRSEIKPNDDEKPYLRNVLRKLDYLLEKYLLFTGKRFEFQSYLVNVRQQTIPDNAPVFEIDDENRGKKKRRSSAKPPSTDNTAALDAWANGIVEDVKGFYEQETDRLMHQSSSAENLHNKALLEKRIEIMGRRGLYVQRIAEIFSNLTHQMKLMEDTLGLISDEIRARSPEQVLAEIDSVVNQSDVLTETLREMAPFDELEVPDGAEQLYNLPR